MKTKASIKDLLTLFLRKSYLQNNRTSVLEFLFIHTGTWFYLSLKLQHYYYRIQTNIFLLFSGNSFKRIKQ